ncbi:MAG: UDP-N-acetylmuramate dehydrogenase [Nitrospirota bacterium]|nr:UDP-N-acetylmuramate dehydrogenase [Nitrospirota bacterium]MDH5700005.1 UDP-N-acetylmuramate dehydrogenase [Nitrospirota bacterium]
MKTGRPTLTVKRLQRAMQHVQGEVRWNEPLAPFLSLQVGGPADVLVFPSDVEDVIRVILGARAERIPFVVLGGTNVVVRDKGIRGIVMQLKQLTGIHEEAGHVVYAQAGVRLPRLMQFAVGRHLSGMEWAAGIPGTVGGGVVMNAGTRLGEMKEVLCAVDLVNLRGHRLRVEASNISFAYRKATLPKGIVVGAWVKLALSMKEDVEAKTKAYLQYRRETQPLTLPNAGSVFKNPPGDSAGRLVEAAGLKGVRVGDAEVSTKHANFIVNRGTATADQVLALIRKVRQTVARKFGVRLQLEWKIIGES